MASLPTCCRKGSIKANRATIQKAKTMTTSRDPTVKAKVLERGRNLFHWPLRLEKKPPHLDPPQIGAFSATPPLRSSATTTTRTSEPPISCGMTTRYYTFASPSKKPQRVFYGFEVPEKPQPPADDLCCMSGCASCVIDVYHEALEQYQEAIVRLRTSLGTLEVPEKEWPSDVKLGGKDGEEKRVDSEISAPAECASDKAGVAPVKKQRMAVLDAFEEMERKLMLKKKKIRL